MKAFVLTNLLFSGIFLIYSGCDESVNPGKIISASTIQLDGCVSSRQLLKEETDTCFNYKFYETLIVEFCVEGNCCPDVNRFQSGNFISNDTINVVIADTARNLCRCTCTYILHSEFQNLPLNRYLFRVIKQDTVNTTLYSVYVFKP